MEDIYRKLREAGHNTVDDLMKILQDAHVLEEIVETDEDMRRHFADVTDNANIGFEKFISVIEEVARKNNANMEDIKKKILDASAGFMRNLSQAASTAASVITGAAQTSAR